MHLHRRSTKWLQAIGYGLSRPWATRRRRPEVHDLNDSLDRYNERLYQLPKQPKKVLMYLFLNVSIVKIYRK